MKLKETRQFKEWRESLKDKVAKTRIALRLARLADGQFGDVKTIRDGVSEIRIHYGPGYRIYYLREGDVVIVLLCGGDKGSQDRDIKRALEIAHDWRNRK